MLIIGKENRKKKKRSYNLNLDMPGLNPSVYTTSVITVTNETSNQLNQNTLVSMFVILVPVVLTDRLEIKASRQIDV